MTRHLLVAADAIATNRQQFETLTLRPGVFAALGTVLRRLGADLVFIAPEPGPVEARLGAWLYHETGKHVHMVQTLADALLLPADERWLVTGNGLAPPENNDGILSVPLGTPPDWAGFPARAIAQVRCATIHRKTLETDIQVALSLEGSGLAEIETGLGFFNHMLEQIARHGGMDLTIKATGDLHVDEHHTIEDTALALGEAFLKTLSDKRGLSRYGFTLPMDDALAQVAVDFGGRPWLVWEVSFKRERIGDVPTELFSHFFKSFSDAARCNLHIRASGENEHHLIESIFKAFARALRMAVRLEGDALPSTKGTL